MLAEIVLTRGKATEFARLVEDAYQALAPDLIVPEVVNTVWKYHQFEGSKPEHLRPQA